MAENIDKFISFFGNVIEEIKVLKSYKKYNEDYRGELKQIKEKHKDLQRENKNNLREIAMFKHCLKDKMINFEVCGQCHGEGGFEWHDSDGNGGGEICDVCGGKGYNVVEDTK